MLIQKPRGTKDLYGEDLLRIQELCQIIENLFRSYGYIEIQTPLFEHIEVFAGNDQALLGTNKEFFNIKSRDSEEIGYVLRPENTASIARALVENKLINKQVDYPLRYFYKGSYFRYERPQSGRFRQFTQMGIEKINTSSIEEDIENLLLIQQLQKKLNLDLKLKLNFLGDQQTKENWNKRLTEYFESYREQLTPISQQRITQNPLRILDDKVDSKKDFVKNAPKIESYFSEESKTKLRDIKTLLNSLNIQAEWDPNLVRGIDYYTGLIYEWIDPTEEITVIAGGRYDQLFERFNYPSVPSLGLAIGIERLKALLEKRNYQWKTKLKYLYLYPKVEISLEYYKWISLWRDSLPPNTHCIVSYRNISPDKHHKLAKKYSINVVIHPWENKSLTQEEINTVLNKLHEI